MTRRQMRESCFILLFEKCFSNYSPEEIVEIAKETEEIAVNDTVIYYFLGVEAVSYTHLRYFGGNHRCF